jgi:hypothetical protein
VVASVVAAGVLGCGDAEKPPPQEPRQADAQWEAQFGPAPEHGQGASFSLRAKMLDDVALVTVRVQKDGVTFSDSSLGATVMGYRDGTGYARAIPGPAFRSSVSCVKATRCAFASRSRMTRSVTGRWFACSMSAATGRRSPRSRYRGNNGLAGPRIRPAIAYHAKGARATPRIRFCDSVVATLARRRERATPQSVGFPCKQHSARWPARTCAMREERQRRFSSREASSTLGIG